MWRDPLDELIDDLERVAPDPRAARGDLLPFMKLQALTDAILYGTSDQVEMLTADPDYQRWVRHCAETRRRSHADPPSASGLASLDRTVPTCGDD